MAFLSSSLTWGVPTAVAPGVSAGVSVPRGPFDALTPRNSAVTWRIWSELAST